MQSSQHVLTSMFRRKVVASAETCGNGTHTNGGGISENIFSYGTAFYYGCASAQFVIPSPCGGVQKLGQCILQLTGDLVYFRLVELRLLPS